MITEDLVGRARRNWKVVVVGLACTLLAAVVALRQSDPVYWMQADFVFVAPGAQVSGPVNPDVTAGLVAFAGAVEREVNDGAAVRRLASPTATLYGAGERQGYSVILPSSGGQWVTSFDRPTLSVQVVDPTSAGAQRTFDQVAARIDEVADRLQDESGTPSDERISVAQVPADVRPSDVGSAVGGRVRGLAALGVVGVTLTAIVAALADRRRTGAVATDHRPLD